MQTHPARKQRVEAGEDLHGPARLREALAPPPRARAARAAPRDAAPAPTPRHARLPAGIRNSEQRPTCIQNSEQPSMPPRAPTPRHAWLLAGRGIENSEQRRTCSRNSEQTSMRPTPCRPRHTEQLTTTNLHTEQWATLHNSDHRTPCRNFRIMNSRWLAYRIVNYSKMPTARCTWLTCDIHNNHYTVYIQNSEQRLINRRKV